MLAALRRWKAAHHNRPQAGGVDPEAEGTRRDKHNQGLLAKMYEMPSAPCNPLVYLHMTR